MGAPSPPPTQIPPRGVPEVPSPRGILVILQAKMDFKITTHFEERVEINFSPYNYWDSCGAEVLWDASGWTDGPLRRPPRSGREAYQRSPAPLESLQCCKLKLISTLRPNSEEHVENNFSLQNCRDSCCRSHPETTQRYPTWIRAGFAARLI